MAFQLIYSPFEPVDPVIEGVVADLPVGNRQGTIFSKLSSFIFLLTLFARLFYLTLLAGHLFIFKITYPSELKHVVSGF